MILNFIKKILNPHLTRKFSAKLTQNTNKVFLHDKYDKFTFDQLFQLSKKLSQDLLNNSSKSNLNGEKIAVLCSNNYTYLISILAVWMSNGVPLGINKSYPNNLIEYFINDSKCKLVINGTGQTDPQDQQQNSDLDSLLSKYKVVNYKLNESNFYKTQLSPNSDQDSLESIRNLLNLEESKTKEGLILYTSGTSGPPKGVVLTRLNILRTIETLIKSWQISPQDSLLHVLPSTTYTG